MSDQEKHQQKIITYQVITGNYSVGAVLILLEKIITYQVITGNYSLVRHQGFEPWNYNIPSNNRELQHQQYNW